MNRSISKRSVFPGRWDFHRRCGNAVLGRRGWVHAVVLLLLGWLAPLSSHAGSAQVVPEGVWAGAFTYASLEYRKAWDNSRHAAPIGADLVDQINAALGGKLVAGRYEADYDFTVFDLYVGLTSRTTFHLQIPYFRSKVRQSVDVFAPPPQNQGILGQLEAMGIRDETLKGDGLGDVQAWLYHQYYETPRWTLTAGAGWRTHVLATGFSYNTEKLNVGTRESESALFNHVVDLKLWSNASLSYRFELQYPLEGNREVFRPGEGIVRVRHTPGRYMTHELELKTHWLGRRLTGTVGAWYREESKSEIDGFRDASGKDYLWGKLAVGYDGMTDYENGVLPIPLFVELRYWHLESARNTRAYMGSYWEMCFAIPLWKW